LVRQPPGKCPYLPFSFFALTPPKGDQREPHDSGREVDPEYLSKLGILHFNYPNLEDVNKIATERSYKNRDEITISPKTMGDVYEEKVKMFFNEHLHEDEEIRYILDGGGFFDVRSKDDDWVRIKLEKFDLMIMPAGIYHRFTTDTENVSNMGLWLFKC
jgi:1,2-dihydroxy-3-keto-5-methylthiopentene dioxygenase